jgi:PAS domain S-box-containing protein
MSSSPPEEPVPTDPTTGSNEDRLNAELVKANALLHLALEAGKSVAWDWEVRSGRDAWLGDLQTVFGIDSTTYVGHVEDFRRRVHPEDRETVWRAVKRAMDNQTMYVAEFRVIRLDGAVRWLSAQGRFYYSSTGEPERMLGIAVDITQRKAAEEALTVVSGKLIEAQENERARIARDLHDDVGQRLAVILVTLDHLAQSTMLLPDAASRLDDLRKQIIEVSDSLHHLSHELHSAALQHLGMVKAMEGFCMELSEQQDLEITFSCMNVPNTVGQDVALCLFRVLQEALHNALKHSEVQRFGVGIRGTDNAIFLTVRDSGVGFDPGEAIRGHGLGLVSMQERLKLVNGELFIDAQRGRGTAIRARVPLDQAKATSSAR